MVKRYREIIGYGTQERPNGEYVLYTDHAAEMDKLRAHLEVAVEALEVYAELDGIVASEALDKIRGME